MLMTRHPSWVLLNSFAIQVKTELNNGQIDERQKTKHDSQERRAETAPFIEDHLDRILFKIV